MGVTTTRSERVRALTIEDLPTLGRPRIASLRGEDPPSSDFGAASPTSFDFGAARGWGSRARRLRGLLSPALSSKGGEGEGSKVTAESSNGSMPSLGMALT